ncbi:hypothetical protein [Pyrococcus kukulkanii]|uniref:Uncharacterized protein n=1 Tax=Pyrococcus kukulkanii TaxID=1609559 RepID=A0A127BCK0_9EURY|nr:hypothetical protein [Pyrococcus kukulkanii]AMM54396.1 hypothetical protein TQ32_07830 [Pyrococcus kukulkanii]
MVTIREVLNLERGLVIIAGNPKWLLKLLIDKFTEKGIVAMERLPVMPKFPNKIVIGNVFSVNTKYVVLFNVITDKRHHIMSKVLERAQKSVIVDYEENYMFSRILKSEIGRKSAYIITYKIETVGFEKLGIIKLENGKIVSQSYYVRKKL